MSSLRMKLWSFISNLIPNYYRLCLKMDIGKNVVIARTAHLDKNVNPKGVHIGDNVWILRNVVILAHDHCRGQNGKSKMFDTVIDKNCIIGVGSIILPGIIIGQHSVVAAGSVVTKNVPSHSIVGGNPAVVLKTDIVVSDNGQIIHN